MVVKFLLLKFRYSLTVLVILPKSVRNAIFASKVCIKNVYQDEYLYAANKCFNYDNDRRMAFTWTPKNEENDKFRWKIKPDGNNFYIVNVAFNETLYAASNYFNYDNDRRMVFTWISGGRVARDVWMIKPDGNNCSIMNVKLKEHLYAADYAKYDNDRRRVFTWIPGGQVLQGMWIIEDCGSTVRKVRDIVSNAREELDQELLDAAKVGDMSKVKDSVNRGADVNTKDRDGNTPSRNAVLKGHFGIFKYLVENGVGLEGKDHRCGPSICDASYSGNLDILKYLIGKGVDVNESDKNGWTPLHFAAWRGYLEVANFLIEKGANINVENIFGRKPIHVAAENNNKDIIDASIKDNSGWTPLHWASWNGHLDVAKYLIGRGANLVNIKDKDGKTPLDIADQKGYTDIVEILKQAQSGLYKKYNELLIAVLENNLIKVKNLVSQGTSLETKDSYGWTLLHFASIYNYSDMAEYLINKGVDINARDQYGKTPLHLTSWFNRLDAMKCLISNNADINAKDNNGKTPLDGSGFNSDAKRVLMQAHLDKELLTTVEGNYLEKIKGLIAQDVSKDRHGAYYYAWSGNLNMVKFLVERDVDVNATDKYGCTLLHWATLKGHLDVAKFLTSKGANVNAEDILGRKPIHFAVINDHRNIIEFLLDKGIIVNSADKQGHTPLHWASWSGHLDMVKYLIDKGANINAKCEADRTPLDIARGRGHSNIVKYLEEKLNQEREKPVQRRRRHHHGDHSRNHNHSSHKFLSVDSSNQPEIAASSGTRPSSWINDLFGWVKSSIGGLLGSRAALPEKTFTQSSISQISAPIDVNGTIMLLDMLIRKATGQKYISTVDQSISPLEAQGYALNITKGFEKVVEQAGLKSGVSMHRLNIDYMGMQKEITRKVMSGKFNEISGVLSSYIEKACPSREAGKLSPKKFEKFMATFNNKLDVSLNQSIHQMLHNENNVLKMDNIKEPQSLGLSGPRTRLDDVLIAGNARELVAGRR